MSDLEGEQEGIPVIASKSDPDDGYRPMITRMRDFFRAHSDFYDPPDVGDVIAEYGATPEARSMPLIKPPSLKEAYAELTVLRERVKVLEEALRQAGLDVPPNGAPAEPLYP